MRELDGSSSYLHILIVWYDKVGYFVSEPVRYVALSSKASSCMYAKPYMATNNPYPHRDVCWLPSDDPRTKATANGFINTSVCVPRLRFVLEWVLLYLGTFNCSWLDSAVLSSSLHSPSPWERVKLTAPLSFAQAAMEGFSIIPVWSWVLSMFVSNIPLISPCKSLRGRSRAKQQEKDHCGFLRHSLKNWYRYTKYWTDGEMKKKYN